MTNRPFLGSLTADELRDRAWEYRQMAKTATTLQTGLGLLRLAEEFEALAAARDEKWVGRPREGTD